MIVIVYNGAGAASVGGSWHVDMYGGVRGDLFHHCKCRFHF